MKRTGSKNNCSITVNEKKNLKGTCSENNFAFEAAQPGPPLPPTHPPPTYPPPAALPPPPLPTWHPAYSLSVPATEYTPSVISDIAHSSVISDNAPSSDSWQDIAPSSSSDTFLEEQVAKNKHLKRTGGEKSFKGTGSENNEKEQVVNKL